MSMWSTSVRGEEHHEQARLGLSVSAVVPDIHPRAVVRVRGVEDVQEALAGAATHGLQVTTRSGGHSASFAALRDDAVALDLRDLADVHVDATAGTAVVGPGATSLAAAEALHGTGWSFPVGHRATVGLGGYLIAGGNGWNHGMWGSACESVTAADVVLADGSTRRIDVRSDPEAYAALRGAGPGFPGVITAFHLRLWREQRVHRRIVSFPAVRAPEVGTWADELAATIDPAVELTVFLAPPGSPLHPDLDGAALTVSATAYAEHAVAAAALLAPLDVLPADGRLVHAGPSDIPTMVETETAPADLGVAAHQAWTTSGYADVLPALVAPIEQSPSPWSSILVSSSSYRRIAPPSTQPTYLPLGTLTVAAYSNWQPGDRDEQNRRWAGDAVDTLRPAWTGHYIGEVDLLREPDRLGHCFAPGVLERIDAVRARLDPEGRFADYPGRG